MSGFAQHFFSSSTNDNFNETIREIDDLIEIYAEVDNDQDGSDQLAKLRSLSFDTSVSGPELFVRQLYIQQELSEHVSVSPEARRLRDECLRSAEQALSDRSADSSVEFFESAVRIMEPHFSKLCFDLNPKTHQILSDLIVNASNRAVEQYTKEGNTNLADRVFVASVNAIDYPYEVPEIWNILYPALNSVNKGDRLMFMHDAIDETDPISRHPIIEDLGYKNTKEFKDSSEEEIRQRVFLHEQARSIENGQGANLVLPRPA